MTTSKKPGSPSGKAARPAEKRLAARQPAAESKRGRPSKLALDDETLRKIENLAKIQCTEDEAAAILGVDQSTLSRFLHKHKKAMEVWMLGIRTGTASLRRMQFKAAEDGNVTMLIWLGKQFLGQKDQHHVVGDHKLELRSRAASVRGEMERKLARLAGGPNAAAA
jgi:hypothetical protein